MRKLEHFCGLFSHDAIHHRGWNGAVLLECIISSLIQRSYLTPPQRSAVVPTWHQKCSSWKETAEGNKTRTRHWDWSQMRWNKQRGWGKWDLNSNLRIATIHLWECWSHLFHHSPASQKFIRWRKIEKRRDYVSGIEMPIKPTFELRGNRISTKKRYWRGESDSYAGVDHDNDAAVFCL